jgi:hypothetical protein
VKLELSAAHARRFVVGRHLLAPPRALPRSPASVLEVIRRLGSLQFDPLVYPGAKSHDLVLHARIDGYRVGDCEALLYGAPGDRRLFEAYNKSLNILPIEDMPYHRVSWERAAARYEERVFRARAAAVELVFTRLDAEGPLTTDAFKDMSARIDWHWGPTPEGRAVLEALFEAGHVGIARRDGAKRAFDRASRLFPGQHLDARVTVDQARAHRLLSRHRGVGLMGASGASELVLGLGDAAARAKSLSALIDSGAITEVRVEGLKRPRYVLTEELPIVERTSSARRSAGGVAFIAPLDPLLWDRRLLEGLFGFDYKWEVYTPESKRRWGYYVLPILFRDAFVGRIEPRMDRAEERLHLEHLSFEEGFDPTESRFARAFHAALEAYRRLVDARAIVWPRTRAARALRAAAT